MARRQNVPATITLTTSLSAAVRGAQFVITQMRVGGEWWVNKALGVKDIRRIKLKSAGLNHLAWIYQVSVDGKDATDRLFNLPDKRLKLLGWPVELLRTIRMVPIGYLRYYYFPD